MGVFVTEEGAEAAAANSGRLPMFLPDPKAPGMRPGKPLEPGRWEYFNVDRYRIHLRTTRLKEGRARRSRAFPDHTAKVSTPLTHCRQQDTRSIQRARQCG